MLLVGEAFEGELQHALIRTEHRHLVDATGEEEVPEAAVGDHEHEGSKLLNEILLKRRGVLLKFVLALNELSADESIHSGDPDVVSLAQIGAVRQSNLRQHLIDPNMLNLVNFEIVWG